MQAQALAISITKFNSCFSCLLIDTGHHKGSRNMQANASTILYVPYHKTLLNEYEVATRKQTQAQSSTFFTTKRCYTNMKLQHAGKHKHKYSLPYHASRPYTANYHCRFPNSVYQLLLVFISRR